MTHFLIKFTRTGSTIRDGIEQFFEEKKVKQGEADEKNSSGGEGGI